ncbi:hypothetical protein QR680_009035 [Steinernema hermaphroditum]|uniref:Uncharacterized protein n=1 Tax=Steinernema hermaphroditum TaxID=289476 RepID=A0AA39IIS6_9BILA|nr:hypothetical protein QR680_009035 [Steinernema hermaphroditum]
MTARLYAEKNDNDKKEDKATTEVKTENKKEDLNSKKVKMPVENSDHESCPEMPSEQLVHFCKEEKK